MHDDLHLSTSARIVIKVIGVGGAGGNAVNRMITGNVSNVEFIVANTDVQALGNSSAQRKIQLGKTITRGLGAGADPTVGYKSALEAKDEIREALAGSNMIFITAGMGGGTGTGAAPVIAEIASEIGALIVAIVTTPFHFEGKQRMEKAKAGIEKLIKSVDTSIIIPNQNLLSISNTKTTFKDAFSMADEILMQGITGITEIINTPGLINVDFADVTAIMKNGGNAHLGIGIGTGDNRAAQAASRAISHALLGNKSLAGAKRVLINIIGGSDITINEYEEIIGLVTLTCDKEANIIAGTTLDSSFTDKIQVVVIATGDENYNSSGDNNNKNAESQNKVRTNKFKDINELTELLNQVSLRRENITDTEKESNKISNPILKSI